MHTVVQCSFMNLFLNAYFHVVFHFKEDSIIFFYYFLLYVSTTALNLLFYFKGKYYQFAFVELGFFCFFFRVTISSNTVPLKIPSLVEETRERIARELEDQLVSVLVDGCSKNYRHFIGVNVQFVKNGKIIVRTLAVEELHLPSTEANLKIQLPQF